MKIKGGGCACLCQGFNPNESKCQCYGCQKPCGGRRACGARELYGQEQCCRKEEHGGCGGCDVTPFTPLFLGSSQDDFKDCTINIPLVYLDTPSWKPGLYNQIKCFYETFRNDSTISIQPIRYALHDASFTAGLIVRTKPYSPITYTRSYLYERYNDKIAFTDGEDNAVVIAKVSNGYEIIKTKYVGGDTATHRTFTPELNSDALTYIVYIDKNNTANMSDQLEWHKRKFQHNFELPFTISGKCKCIKGNQPDCKCGKGNHIVLTASNDVNTPLQKFIIFSNENGIIVAFGEDGERDSVTIEDIETVGRGKVTFNIKNVGSATVEATFGDKSYSEDGTKLCFNEVILPSLYDGLELTFTCSPIPLVVDPVVSVDPVVDPVVETIGTISKNNESSKASKNIKETNIKFTEWCGKNGNGLRAC